MGNGWHSYVKEVIEEHTHKERLEKAKEGLKVILQEISKIPIKSDVKEGD